MMHGKAKIFIAALLLMSQYLTAQSVHNLSLTEAIALSVINSKQLQLNQARIKEATGRLREARDNRLPDLKATGAYMRVDNPNIDLKIKLPTPAAAGGQEATTNTLSNIKVSQAAYGIASASLPLFSGFRIRYGIESQKYLLRAAELDAANDTQAIKQNTIEAYSNLYKALQSVILIKQNLKQAQKRITNFTNLEKNGTVVHNDVLKVQLRASDIKLSLMEAQNNYDLACVSMNLMLGLPEDTKLVPDSSSIAYPADVADVFTWETQALDNRKDIAALSIREQAADKGILAAKGNYYPNLALTANYIAADIPNLLTAYNVISGGIGLQYNIGALWKTKAKVIQAEAQRQQVEISKNILSDAVRLQINKAYKNFILSVQKIDVYAEAITEAEDNYRITQSKYDNKVATTQDLLDADTQQLQAELNYAFAKIDAMVAYKKLQQVSGTLK